MRLTGLRRTLSTTKSFVSSLQFELLIVATLLLSTPSSFHLLSLGCIHLIASHLRLIVQLLLSFSRFSAVFFFDLILKEAPQHVFLFNHPVSPFFLLLSYSLLKLLNFFFFELGTLKFTFSIADSSLISVDILESILVFHELVVVLLIN